MQSPVDPSMPSPSLPRRLAAMVYDTLLVLPIVMAVVALATGLQVAVLGGSSEADFSSTLPSWLVQLLAVVTVACFYTFFWCRSGQSLGMQAWRIKLRDVQGRTITQRRALLRCAGAFISFAALGLGYLWCLVDRDGRYWHDHWSGTCLELLPKKQD